MVTEESGHEKSRKTQINGIFNQNKKKEMKTYKFTINGNKYTVDINNIEDGKAAVEVNRTPYTVELEMEDLKVPQPKVVKVAAPVVPQAAAPKATVAQAPAAPTSGATIKAPLPGVVLDVFVHEGDAVKAGQHVMMLEAMKMENNIDAPKDGVIKQIRARKGDSVMEGDVLIVLE